MSDAKYCKDCKNINCPEGRVNCKYPDAIACDIYRDTPQTLFDRITQSEKMLAENVVYSYEMAIGGSTFRVYWTSPFVENLYPDKAEAIAATVARLKEVYNETASN